MSFKFAKHLKSPLKIFHKTSVVLSIILFFVVSFQQYNFLTPIHAIAASYPPTGISVSHYLYTFPDGNMYVYDMDNNFNLVYSTVLPGTSTGIRGSVASPTDGMLYISYGSDGGSGSSGSLLKYNLLTNSSVWQKTYNYGIDSMAITPDGKTIYMPDGAASGDGIWNIIDTNTGNITGSITGGQSPHNTVVSLDGSRVYLGGLNNNNFRVASTSTNQVTKTIGPLQAGVRPFTVNGTNTLAFTNATNFLGFQVLDLPGGKVLYTVAPNGFSGSTSHGVSLSPDEREVYLMDASNSYVHVFDVTGLPNNPPKQVADIALTPIIGQETPCAYDCHKEGWVLHSRDGRYVFVGDSGDIINTTTRTLLPRDISSSATIFNTLANTRKYIEIDWQNGVPSFTTSRHGLGYVTSPTPTSTPTPTPNPSGIIAQDTFQRSNQTLWGTASDGQTWSSDANINSIFSINNNAGYVTNGGSTSFNAILGQAANDQEVLFSGSLSGFSNTNIGSVVRWTDTNNWYKAYIEGTNLVLQKKVNGSSTTIKTTPFTTTAGTNYSLRFQAVGNTLNAKVWITTQSEPTNWMVTATDTTFTGGRTGLRMLTGSSTASYTSFTATNLSSITLTPTPLLTPTSTPTFTPSPTPPVTSTPSPTPVAGIIAQDTFQRSNQTH